MGFANEPRADGLDGPERDPPETSERPLVIFASAGDWSVPLIELLQTRFQVVLAASVGEVLDKVATLQPRLLLTGHALEDADALGLCRRLRGDPHLRSISIALLDDGSAAIDEVAALAAGVNRLVRWPGDEQRFFALLEELAFVAARRDARLMVRMDVEMTNGVTTTVGFSHNLSVSGMLLEGKLDTSVGTRLGLRFAVPTCADELCPTAEVVRIQATPLARTQFAVRYTAIAARDRAVIARFVENGRRLGLRRP